MGSIGWRQLAWWRRRRSPRRGLYRHAQVIRCRVAKQSTTLEQRELIAGRSQAKDSTVLDMTMSQRLRWIMRELNGQKKQYVDEHPDDPNADGWTPNRQEAMKNTYYKTGCKEKTEGSVVCELSILCFRLHRCYVHYCESLFRVTVLKPCVSLHRFSFPVPSL